MPELWDLYDSNRQKTDLQIERGQPIPQGLYHLVVSAWIVNSQGKYLLSQRHPDKPYPYFWECTGGSVIAGESSLTGAIREVKEELRITLTLDNARIIYQARREETHDFYDVWLFGVDVSIAELTLQPTEVINAQWVDKTTLISMYENKELHPLIDYINKIF